MPRNKLNLYNHNLNKRTLVGYGYALTRDIPLDTDLGKVMQDGTLQYPMAISTSTSRLGTGTPGWIHLKTNWPNAVPSAGTFPIQLTTGKIVPIQFTEISSTGMPRAVDIRTVTIYYR